MSPWMFFFLNILFLFFVKLYLIRGVYQATRSKRWIIGYSILSIGTLSIGVPTMVTSFSNGIIDLSFYENFIIALMFSVIICELMLAIFFIIDDIWLVGKWIKRKIVPPLPNNDAPMSGRRRFLKTVGIGFMSLPFASFLYGITKGKYDFRVIHQTLLFSDLPDSFDNFRIVQFSDLHAGGFDSYQDVERGINMIQQQNADLVLFTGDLVNDLAAEILPYKSLLQSLHAPFGKFSTLGNHDYPQNSDLFATEEAGEDNLQAIKQHHADMGFRLLNNENHLLTKDTASIRLIGVENWGRGFIKKGNLDKALENVAQEEFSILMSHDPTHWEAVVLKHQKHIHLTLSGHTHGMQMGIELLGIKWSPIQYLYKRWAGLYQEMNQYLYVNRGFGFLAFAGRVGIPPEITVFTLKKA